MQKLSTVQSKEPLDNFFIILQQLNSISIDSNDQEYIKKKIEKFIEMLYAKALFELLNYYLQEESYDISKDLITKIKVFL